MTAAGGGTMSTHPGERQARGGHEADRTQVVDSGRGFGHEQAVPGDVLEAERESYGGVKVGAAFFGWLTAVGMSVLLTALLAATGAAVGVATGTVNQATSQATQNPQTIGLWGAVALAVVLFVAYYCGGYVAGRMARFNGAKQGVAVWLWAIVIAVLVAIAAAVAGNKYDIFANLNSFPRIPVDSGQLTTAGIVALVGAVVIALVGAVLGGLAGMRFHRRVDNAGLAAVAGAPGTARRR